MITNSPVTQPAVIVLPTSCDQKPVEAKERSSPIIRKWTPEYFSEANHYLPLFHPLDSWFCP
jgi:hypothetical protein